MGLGEGWEGAGGVWSKDIVLRKWTRRLNEARKGVCIYIEYIWDDYSRPTVAIATGQPYSDEK